MASTGFDSGMMIFLERAGQHPQHRQRRNAERDVDQQRPRQRAAGCAFEGDVTDRKSLTGNSGMVVGWWLSGPVRCDSLELSRLSEITTWVGRRPPARRYCRAGRRDANPLTDKEWELIEPFPPRAKATGRPRTTDLRTVVEALLYIAWTGYQWRALPDRFPPASTVKAISISRLRAEALDDRPTAAPVLK